MAPKIYSYMLNNNDNSKSLIKKKLSSRYVSRSTESNAKLVLIDRKVCSATDALQKKKKKKEKQLAKLHTKDTHNPRSIKTGFAEKLTR